jgi:hypothetical protein
LFKIFGASEYINAIGGRGLYSKESFDSEDIKLSFLRSLRFEYEQFKPAFVPGLSLIDVLMFNSVERVVDLLGLCELD